MLTVVLDEHRHALFETPTNHPGSEAGIHSLTVVTQHLREEKINLGTNGAFTVVRSIVR